MPKEFTLASPVALPAQSGVINVYKSLNLADAFAIQLPPNASSDPDLLARFLFEHQPAWIGKLMSVRDAIVARLGLKTARDLAALGGTANPGRLGIFKVYSVNAAEIVVGEDDKHLDFRLSILCSSGPAPDSIRLLTLTTVVHCHNLLGRAYILAIAPFHRMVVKASLQRAARIGWPLRQPGK
jgi:hypothetical protein